MIKAKERKGELNKLTKTFCVSGSGGFLGSHLVEYLREKGYEVIEYDLKTGQDILDFEQLHSVFEENKLDATFHLAAQAFVGPGEKDPYLDLDINGKGMLNMLRCVEEFGVPLVFSSSGAVYGQTSTELNTEDSLPRPTANYGCSKRYAELVLQKWVLNTGIEAKIVRFSSVYGPDRTHGPVNIFINKALKGEVLTVFGSGEQTRDLIHVSDACRGLELVLEKGEPGEIYNIGYGLAHSILQVAQTVHNLTGAPVVFVEGHEFTKFDVLQSKFDTTKARRELGFEAQVDLKKGIQLTLACSRQ